MQIPVSHIQNWGSISGSIIYDVDKNKFIDSKHIVNRELPIQDFLSCEMCNPNNIATVVGKVTNTDKIRYVVCFGDNMLYTLYKMQLNGIRISNIKPDHKRITIVDGRLNILNNLFPDKNIQFTRLYTMEEKSSLGQAKKFLGKYNNELCMVKFSKFKGEDLVNEKTYYDIARLLGVDCCRVKLSTYSGKPCCISLYEYNTNDIFASFKSIGKSTSEIYRSLEKSDKIKFDKMMLLDFILSQTDRHMSNIALVNNKPYPLFDNGECLGIGSMGQSSDAYRKYVMSLPKNYIRAIIGVTSQAELCKKLEKIEYYNKKKCLAIINSNLKELNLW